VDNGAVGTRAFANRPYAEIAPLFAAASEVLPKDESPGKATASRRSS
jgi:hypothetical protein